MENHKDISDDTQCLRQRFWIRDTEYKEIFKYINGNMSGRKSTYFNLLTPAGYVMHQQFNIQQLYVLPTLYLCVLYLSENKQRLVPLTA